LCDRDLPILIGLCEFGLAGFFCAADVIDWAANHPRSDCQKHGQDDSKNSIGVGQPGRRMLAHNTTYLSTSVSILDNERPRI
jgi:hypothetical protein